MSLSDAINTYINDGDLIGIGGLSFWRKAVAAGAEIIRQKKKNLGIVSFVGGIVADMLIGAGCVDYIRTSFIGMEINERYYKIATKKIDNDLAQLKLAI